MTALLDRPTKLRPSPAVRAKPSPPRLYVAPDTTALQAIVPPVRRPEPIVVVVCAPMSGRARPVVDVPVRRPESVPVRLTRRGAVLISLLIALGTMGIIVLAAVNAGPAAPSLRDAPASVVVERGDTLWQIATEVAPADDPAMIVERIRAANDLGTAPLQPGQTLILPTG